MEALTIIAERSPVFMLVFIRIGALMFSMPMLGARSIPVPARIFLTLALSWSILPLLSVPQPQQASSLMWWGAAALREALIGLSMGWFAQFFMAAVPLAGQLIGYQMGFGIANVVDPVGQNQMSVIATFLNLIALWLFLALSGHHLAVAAVLKSFQWAPPGTGGFEGGWAKLVLEGGGHLFRSAFMLGAPVMLILMFVKVGLGLVARTVPQMNVFIVALPLQIGIGLTTLGAFLGFFVPWFTRNLKWLDQAYVFLGTIF